MERSIKGNGDWVKQTFACPRLIRLYDTYMGGVDVSDQRVSSYKANERFNMAL